MKEKTPTWNILATYCSLGEEETESKTGGYAIVPISEEGGLGCGQINWFLTMRSYIQPAGFRGIFMVDIAVEFSTASCGDMDT
jgi:hypothetical protein